MALVDLKLSKKDQKEEMSPSTAEPPEFPYGLCLNIDKDELDKLGIVDLPEVGEEFTINAIGCVTAVHSSASGNGKSAGLSLQITKMELTPEGEDEPDNAAEEGSDAEAGEVEGAKTVMHSTYRGK